MKLNIFDENEGWTSKANELAESIEKALTPIINNYEEDGYKLKDVKFVIDTVSSNIILMKLL